MSTPHLTPSNTNSAVKTPQRQVILGSSSTYRKELLSRLHIPFEVVRPDVDESPLKDETPIALASRLALAKARAVALMYPQAVVIGSDQVADLMGQHLGKPGTHDKACLQLSQMSGQTVLFHSAVAVVCRVSGFEGQTLASVAVKFRELSDQEIETYLRLEKPYDCAGSAKSEGLGISLLASIDSDDPTALIGLPLIRTCLLLREAGIAIPSP
jgi:septum formation protein